jgi:hypothetical protein
MRPRGIRREWSIRSRVRCRTGLAGFPREIRMIRVQETQQWTPHFGSYAILVRHTTVLWHVRTSKLAIHHLADDSFQGTPASG